MLTPIRAWVELIHHLDAHDWPLRHAAGEVPGRTPFGIDELARHGIEVAFRQVYSGPVTRRVTRLVRERAGGVEWAEAVLAGPCAQRRHADVVLCWDEFTGIPAAALSRLPGGPPVVSGVQLLSDPAGRSAGFVRRARAALRRMDAVFVQAAGMVPVLREEWGVPAAKLHLVRFGVDADWFRPTAAGIDRDLVVSVGDDPHRDHDTLIAAMTAVRSRRPAARLELATQLDVRFPADIGTLHRGHLGPRRRRFYGEAAVVAVATRPNAHGSGMSVILEAMACGRPYVVTASRGLDGYLRDGEDGLVVPPGDVDALAAAVEKLLADPDRADAMGAAGRARLERELTTDVQAAHLAAVIHSVAS
ncbi:MAG TPA: glycosyltransferase family 4 protein [Pseudonocardiaceae bacterium]|jgi:glycosyltransferase involved in cell wall biosynthesis|nr:glycosyltransferase family 4 protein [Pseudonocardiaceae bacterium]